MSVCSGQCSGPLPSANLPNDIERRLVGSDLHKSAMPTILVAEKYFQPRAGGGLALQHGMDVFADAVEQGHGRSPVGEGYPGLKIEAWANRECVAFD